MITNNYDAALVVDKIIKARVRDIKDFPVSGVLFRDITPLLSDGPAFKRCIDELYKIVNGMEIGAIAGIESRGFIIGAPLAYEMGVGFIPIRKSGKLPYKKINKDYELEYGKTSLEMHMDAVEDGKSVLIVDDILATGGSASAAASLIRAAGGRVAGFAFLIELSELK